MPIARIRQLAGTDRGGTSLRGLIEAAEHLGLTARGVRAPTEALVSVPTPAIAHVKDPRGWLHYVVVYRASGTSVTVMDPAAGEVRRIPLAEFAEAWTGVVLLLAPKSGVALQDSDHIAPILRLWRIAAPHRTTIAQASVGALAYTVLGLAAAVFVQKIVDFVIPDGSRDLLDLMTFAMVLVIALQIYLRCVKDLLVLRTGQKIDAGLLLGYYDHLLRLPQRFFDTMRTGEIVSRLNDAVKIRLFVNEVSLELLVNLLVVVCSLGLMATYSWRLAAVVGASIPIYVAIYWVSNRLHRQEQRRVMEAAADLEAHLVESVGAAALLRRLRLEQQSVEKAEIHLVRLLRPIYAVGRTALASGGAAELVSRLGTVALLWFGTVLVLREELTAGELMSFYALNGHLTVPVLGLIAANRQVQDALVAADRLFEIIDLEREQDGGVVGFPAPGFGALRFRGVHFRYGSRPPLFRGLDLAIREGAITAIVGESGSGKSTLAALAQRLYQPHGGRILFGEVDIRYIRRDSLLDAVCVVPQDTVLLSGSLLENLIPGVPEPEISRLAVILAQLGLEEFVDALPEGLGTQVGERGLALSGGQRQRIAIARAIYRRPRVLILDEATSGLDAAAEARVFQVLRELQRDGTTVVLITHRLTSALHANRVLVLHEGALAEEGTHRELLRSAGAYMRLWRHQTSGVSFEQGVDAC